MVTKGVTQRFGDWNLSSSSGGGGISTYKNKERIEGKEKGSNIPKSCLQSSPGVVTAENANPEHKPRIGTEWFQSTYLCNPRYFLEPHTAEAILKAVFAYIVPYITLVCRNRKLSHRESAAVLALANCDGGRIAQCRVSIGATVATWCITISWNSEKRSERCVRV
ncbi:hypothetical protein J6590_059139, partial [Homalodisca vitripennis]